MAFDPDGIILLDKPAGVTSFRALAEIKKKVNRKTGHAGTLDRFATGLLIALCGKSTKKFDSFMLCDKTYEAVIELGKTTDTLDPEGTVTKTCAAPPPSISDIESVLKSDFTGKISQLPPLFSALHVGGKRAWELALKERNDTAKDKAHEDKNTQLKPREVTIYESRVIAYEYPLLSLSLTVSKGCYIRSVARDLGEALGTCGYVRKLRRTRIGEYRVENAIDPFSI